MSAQTIAAVLREVSAALASAGCPDAPRDARALVAHATGLAPMALTLEGGRFLSDAEGERLAAAVARRTSREPVSHILGYREFWGRRFEVSGAVLDPRPETETIIEAALERGSRASILDLGTGSGCLAVTLAAEWPDAQVVAVDISPDALSVARRNAAAHDVAQRITFHAGSWFQPLDARFDLIVSNPPYISAQEMDALSPEVAEWEPHIALTPGGDGLGAYLAIAKGLRTHLAPGGAAFLEFGQGQGPAVMALFRAAGWADCRLLPDLSGRPRVLAVLDSENAL